MYQYEEVGSPDVLSRHVRLLFTVSAGTVWDAHILSSNITGNLEGHLERIEASAALVVLLETSTKHHAAQAQTAANTAATAAEEAAFRVVEEVSVEAAKTISASLSTEVTDAMQKALAASKNAENTLAVMNARLEALSGNLAPKQTVQHSAAYARGVTIASLTNFAVPPYKNTSLAVYLDGVRCVAGTGIETTAKDASWAQYVECPPADNGLATAIQWLDAISPEHTITVISFSAA